MHIFTILFIILSVKIVGELILPLILGSIKHLILREFKTKNEKIKIKERNKILGNMIERQTNEMDKKIIKNLITKNKEKIRMLKKEK